MTDKLKPCQPGDDSEFHAWRDEQPGASKKLYVTAKMCVGSTGIVLELTERAPQGINETILQLELESTDTGGNRVFCWKETRFEKDDPDGKYTHVEIFSDGKIIFTDEVEIVS